MPGKKKADEPKDVRPPGPFDAELEEAREELAQVEAQLSATQKRHMQTLLHVSRIRNLEEQIPQLQEKLRKIGVKFKRLLVPDRPDSADGLAKPQGTVVVRTREDRLAPLVHTPEYRELQHEAHDKLMGILQHYYKMERKREDHPPSPMPTRRVSSAKLVQRKREETAAEGEPELKCPLGIAQDVFQKVLELRTARLQVEEEIDKAQAELQTLKAQVVQAKLENVSKAVIKKLEKQLLVKQQHEREAARRVQQEDEEWRRQLEEKKDDQMLPRTASRHR
eukprot:Sspe_Gene.23573::Locus_9166_Transcript_1_3_Confidence_0.500_Length_2346::g.23573::m.23573